MKMIKNTATVAIPAIKSFLARCSIVPTIPSSEDEAIILCKAYKVFAIGVSKKHRLTNISQAA